MLMVGTLTATYASFPVQRTNSNNTNTTVVVENQEDGVIQELQADLLGKWLGVGTVIGILDDGDKEIDGDWTWQAYKHS